MLVYNREKSWSLIHQILDSDHLRGDRVSEKAFYVVYCVMFELWLILQYVCN